MKCTACGTTEGVKMLEVLSGRFLSELPYCRKHRKKMRQKRNRALRGLRRLDKD